ncbi:hypothetical protein [Brevundimonas bacteroides]|uniref:hypothetical protein n=1 Tax=Brevundimonas bacteroides TaxID=74311 RepID=UPI000692215B|nr:hypothetical protein [Brevundimonas bacteroides]
MSGVVTALALALMQAAGPAQAQDVGAQEPVAQLPEVVVEGRSVEEQADVFIDEVAAPPRGATVARWNERVCVGAVGLPETTARYLIDRVSAVAMSVELEPGEPGCDPTVIIVATLDGGAVAQGLVERRRNVLAPGNAIQSRSRRELAEFATVDRPVRWWHISTAVDPDSGRSVVRRPADDTTNASIEQLIQSAIRGSNSLITASTRQHLRRAVIIIDFDEIGDDIDFDQLADYVAFVALAQVDPEADTSGFSTILNLFDDPTTPGLTAWDSAYLWGLYNSDDTARGNSGREAALRREMLRARERTAEPPE